MIQSGFDLLEQMFANNPGDHIYIKATVAAILVIFTEFIGWLVSKWAAPPLARIWESRAGYESELARRRIRDMCRRATTFIFASFFLAIYDWQVIGNVIFALTIAIVAGLFTNDLIRGVRMPDWLGTIMGIMVAVGTALGLVNQIEMIYIAMESVGVNIGSRRLTLWGFATAAVTAVILLAIARVVIRLANHIINSSEWDSAQKVLAQKLATVVILVIAGVLGLDVLGIDLTALAFFSGAFGLAIGFGMQKTVGNLIAGIILLMDRSIKPGDVVAVGDSFGWVNKIGVRAVSVLTREGKEHLIPNEDLMTREVENWSYSNKNVRISIPVGVSYDSDMDQVIELMMQACEDVPRVLNHPKPVVWMTEFGDNSVNFEIRCWINDPQSGVGNFKAAVLKRVWDLFKENDIEIPFPQRDVHIKSMPSETKAALKPGTQVSR